MKRYLVFSGSSYYPAGGAKDYNASFDKDDDAIFYILKDLPHPPNPYYIDWAHIFDAEKCEIILEWFSPDPKIKT